MQTSMFLSHIAVDVPFRNPNAGATFSLSVESKFVIFPARLELAIFRVLGGCDNHCNTETTLFLTEENTHH